ncbi:MAG: hypothetical protein QW356_07680 [Candidatus Hadarchaeales archaeon]
MDEKLILGLMVASVVSLVILSIPSVGALVENEQTGQTSATIQVIVSFAIEGNMNWGNVQKNQTNIPIPGANGGPDYTLTIRAETNVRTKIQFRASDMTTARTGGDNIIESTTIKIWQSGAGSGSSVNGNNNVYTDIPWLTSIPVPSGSDNNILVYPTIDTSSTQLAGTYTGTFGFKAVELTT